MRIQKSCFAHIYLSFKYNLMNIHVFSSYMCDEVMDMIRMILDQNDNSCRKDPQIGLALHLFEN